MRFETCSKSTFAIEAIENFFIEMKKIKMRKLLSRVKADRGSQIDQLLFNDSYLYTPYKKVYIKNTFRRKHHFNRRGNPDIY